MNGKTLYVLLNSDTDPATEPISPNFDKETVWEITTDLVKKIREVLNNFEDSYGNIPRVVWHLRSDNQIKSIWGEWNYPVTEYRYLWRSLKREGDEIGWHPHLWRFDSTRNSWYQERQDVRWIKDCLKNGYKAITSVFNIESSRMGWDFHNNLTMRLLSELGIKYDLSAVPGVAYNGGMYNIYDWEPTPHHPYYPSIADYRVPGTPSLNILEIPLTTFKFPWYMHWAYTRVMHTSLCTAHLGKHPFIMKYAIKHAINNAKKNSKYLLNMFFHPGDFNGKSRIFSIEYITKNMKYMKTISKKEKVQLKFILPKDVERLLPENELKNFNSP